MKRPLAMILSAAAAACVVVGCGVSSPESPDASPEVAALVTRLRESGLAVTISGETVEQPFFPVRGQILLAGGEQIQVFSFASAESAAAAAGTVSADGGTIGTTSVLWIAPPHFYRSGRLIVLYVGRDTQVLGGLRSALGEPFASRAS